MGLPPEFWREHERVQKLLAERIAFHQAKAEEERARSAEQPAQGTAGD